MPALLHAHANKNQSEADLKGFSENANWFMELQKKCSLKKVKILKIKSFRIFKKFSK